VIDKPSTHSEAEAIGRGSEGDLGLASFKAPQSLEHLADVAGHQVAAFIERVSPPWIKPAIKGSGKRTLAGF